MALELKERLLSSLPNDIIFKIRSLVSLSSHRIPPVPEAEDRLTSLPDDLVLRILSSLSVKDAAKMSSLSTRWKRLCSISDLDFRDSDLAPMPRARKCSLLSKNQRRCIDTIDRILTACSKSRSINSFSLSRFFLPHIDPTTLARWFEILRERGIRRLSLRSDGFPLYSLPSCSLFSCPTLVELDLRFCRLLSSFALPRLQILSLKHTLVSEECLDGLLSGCSALEILKMRYCKGLKKIRICSKSLRKFDIKIASSSSEITEIVIENAPNLEQLVLCEHAKKTVKVRVVHALKLR